MARAAAAEVGRGTPLEEWSAARKGPLNWPQAAAQNRMAAQAQVALQ